MSKNFKNFFVSAIALFLVLVIYSSYTFYKITSRNREPKTVNSCNELLIDSIRAFAVRDTAKYFNYQVDSLNSLIREKDAQLSAQKKTIQVLRRDKDSLAIRLQLSRQRYKDLVSDKQGKQ